MLADSNPLSPQNEFDSWEEVNVFGNSEKKKLTLNQAIFLANQNYSLRPVLQAVSLPLEYYFSHSGWTEKSTCPFPDHDDSTASFYFHPEKNIFHCFGCQKSGGPAQFLSYYENISLSEALKKLVQNYQPQNKISDFKNISDETERENEILHLLQEHLLRVQAKINPQNFEQIEKINWSLHLFLRRSPKFSDLNPQELKILLCKIAERIDNIST